MKRHNSRSQMVGTVEKPVMHIGMEENDHFASLNPPIYQTTAFELPNHTETAALFRLEKLVPIYARTDNPTTRVLEARIAAIEGGSACSCFATGKAAIAAAIFAITGSGDNIVASKALFSGTMAMFASTMKNLGIEVRFTTRDTPDSFAKLSDDRTKLWYGETVSNPHLMVFPIAEIAEMGRALGIPLIVDNTLGVGLCKPLTLGAAVTVVSLSKYVSSNGSALGGAITEGDFDWSMSPGRFSWLLEPDPAFGGMVWSDLAREQGTTPYVLRLKLVILRDFGATISPISAYMLCQSTETLELRMPRHADTARRVAAILNDHPKVKSVSHPTLGDTETVQRNMATIPGGACGVVSLDLNGGEAAGKKFVTGLNLFKHMATVGASCSLAIHPYSTQLMQLPERERSRTGVSKGYVRLSIGLENADMLIADVIQSLANLD